MAVESRLTHSATESPNAATTVAAIDIGSNAVRMAIAEVLPNGDVNTLERLHRAVRLGQDTFCRGRLGNRSMGAAIGILRDYCKILDTYRVERTRAVATSASDIPGATTARLADPRWPISWKEFIIPQTVPKRPIKGVVFPVVAKNGTIWVMRVISVLLERLSARWILPIT